MYYILYYIKTNLKLKKKNDLERAVPFPNMRVLHVEFCGGRKKVKENVLQKYKQ